jgi:ABC-type transport system involved in multi-copper enzyme maturation permease subunit
MNAAAGEQASGTIGLLQSLPVPLWKPALAKLLGGMAALLIPLLLALEFVLHFAWIRGSGGDPVAETHFSFNGATIWGLQATTAATFLLSIVLSLSLFLWVSAAGVNSSDEVRAGARGGLLIALCWGVFYGLLWYLIDSKDSSFLSASMKKLYVLMPGGAATVIDQINTSWWSSFGVRLLLALAIHFVVAFVYVSRFGRSSGRIKPAQAFGMVSETEQTLSAPFSTPIRALAWKQLRESAPLGLMGGALIGVLAFIVVISTGIPRDELVQFLAIFWIFVANFIAISAGIGAFWEETQPGLNSFWRSQPLKLGRYFAMKYAGGLTITIVTLGVIPLAIAAAIIAFTQVEFNLPNDWNELLPIITLLPIGLYTAAVAAILLVRQPVYAAIIAIAAAILTAWHSAWIAKQSESSNLATMMVIVTIAAVLTLAYHAFRNDWGWRK